MDFLSAMLEADKPVARQVSYAGQTGTVYFRKISGGERAQLLKGQKVQARAGSATVVDVDLGENQQAKLLLVAFSVCKEDGSRVFADVKAVQKLEASKVEVLHSHAYAVNEDDDPGKS